MTNPLPSRNGPDTCKEQDCNNPRLLFEHYCEVHVKHKPLTNRAARPANEHTLREKLRELPRTTRTDHRYPIDAYEDDLVELFRAHYRSLLPEIPKPPYIDDEFNAGKAEAISIMQERIGGENEH